MDRDDSLLKKAVKAAGKFLNPVPTTIGGLSMMFKVLPRMLLNRQQTEPKTPLGPFVTDTSVYSRPAASGLRVTWFGHSASLVEIDGFRVLIDPVWEQRASPLQSLGPKRFFAPTLKLSDLPKIDVVLISHDHYDHFGSDTVRLLATLPATSKAKYVTSLGVGLRLRKCGVSADRIAELDWTESVAVDGLDDSCLNITAWPARHFSGRGARDRFTTLWSSFVIEGPQHRIYYGADTGPWDGMREIAARYQRFDLTMLEIGAYDPLWYQIHLGPDAAAEAFAAMGGSTHCGLLMPIHWGLFNLALHAWDQPITRMTELAAANGIALWSPEPGKPTECDGTELRSSWWQR